MNPIIRNKTRILRPSEATVLINAIPKRIHELRLKFLLLSGMRYIEAKRFFEHPEWFDGGFIHLPPMAIRKSKRTQKERSVRLNQWGKEVTKSFLELGTNLPTWTTWGENLKRWAVKGGIAPDCLCPKSTRKTMESWLVYYYTDKITLVLLSQGHNMTTSLNHYLNMPFTQEDKNGMKPYVEGWI